MRPSVGSEQFVMSAKALLEVEAERMVHGAAVRVVGVHVAEWDAVVERGERIARSIEALTLQSLKYLFCQSDAGATTARYQRASNRGIQSARTKEIHQRSRNIRLTSHHSARRERRRTTDSERACRIARIRRLNSASLCGLLCNKQIVHHQIATNRVRIDRAVQVPAAVEGVCDVKGVTVS